MNPIFPELPTKLGIYNLTQLIGVREYSELYLAEQSYVDRAVAIEVLRPTSAPEMVEAFQEISRNRAAVKLPHASPVLESARTGNLRYLIQEQPKGTPLITRLEEEGPLNSQQAFILVQQVAELYCACHEQGVAAAAIGMESIYMEGENFYFFSPVLYGPGSKEHREVQMATLADVLEQSLSEKDVAKSNISIIIHWLRRGNGSSSLEWGPLAAALSTLRSQKGPAQKVVSLERFSISGTKRMLRQKVRASVHVLLWLGVMLLIVLGIGSLGLLWNSAWLGGDVAGYVRCGSGDDIWSVMARPVSIREYEEFMNAWNELSGSKKEEISAGIPAGVRNAIKPQEWDEQCSAARNGGEWMGRKLTPDSPVCGVSYWNALICARYMGGDLPRAEILKAVRQKLGGSEVEEWTSSWVENAFPYEPYYAVFPATGSRIIQDINPDMQVKMRSFRVAIKK